jgi:hypothetical protein
MNQHMLAKKRCVLEYTTVTLPVSKHTALCPGTTLALTCLVHALSHSSERRELTFTCAGLTASGVLSMSPSSCNHP